MDEKLLLKIGQFVEYFHRYFGRAAFLGLYFGSMGVRRAGDTKRHIVHLRCDQGGATAVLHIA